MTKHQSPIPLFDTIEKFSNSPNNSSFVFPEDYVSTVEFLKQYKNNKGTFEAYRREIERLIQWAWYIAKRSILTLKRQDMEDYIQFCLKPPKSWIGLKNVPRFIILKGERVPNPRWRPFVATVSKSQHKIGERPDKNKYHLSQKSIQDIFTVLSSFYNYLVLEEKVSSNPVALIRQKSKYIQKQQTHKNVFRLSEKQWEFCIETAKIMIEENSELHQRTLFMLSAMYLMYLRISELAANERWTPQMNHFYQDSLGHWWFKTVGKGNKLREIAVSDAMLSALKDYRLSLKLSPLPSPNETTPLISKEKGHGPLASTRRIRYLIQSCFDKTVERLKEAGFIQEAEALPSATVHWLRHTGISDDINKRKRPVAHVRDDAGHSSSAITDRYNDIHLNERHQSAKNKKLVDALPDKRENE